MGLYHFFMLAAELPQGASSFAPDPFESFTFFSNLNQKERLSCFLFKRYLTMVDLSNAGQSCTLLIMFVPGLGYEFNNLNQKRGCARSALEKR